MGKATRFLFLAALVIGSMQGRAWSAVIYQDNFDDGDYATRDGTNGLSWQVIEGNAIVADRNGSLSLGVYRGTSTIVSEQTISSNKYTLCFDAYITWSEPGRIIVLYKDSKNFYSIGLGSKKGIYRMLEGEEVQLHPDDGNLIRLPHASNAWGSFKIYVENNGKSIVIKADRAGDGVDYDIEVMDADNQAVSLFKNGAVGMITISNPYPSVWFYIDNVVIHDEMVTDSRQPVIYYVDCNTGDDSRSAQEAQNISTPWKTIQKAADIMLSGDTVKVMPGIYRESVVPKFSGAEGRPVTYQAFNPANKPILDGSDIVDLSNWEAVSITDFNGNVHQVYKTRIDWNPKAVFQDGIRMFASQEPNQSNPDDPYNPSEFREVPDSYNDGTSHTELVDPYFLRQPDSGYWVGAYLLLYDGYINAIAESKIVDYIPSENKIVVEGFDIWTFIGRNSGRSDRYAIKHHKGILDKPGEYYVDTFLTPHEIYVWSYPGKDLSTITAAHYDIGFDLRSGYKNYIVIDGFEIRYFQGNGIEVLRSFTNTTIENCQIHHNMGSGTYANYCQGVVVRNSKLYMNHANGATFVYGKDYTVENCEITANCDNGVWVGSGTKDLYSTYDVFIRGNFIHHQGSGRTHPDNYQMHQCQHVVLENNIFIQAGAQNMWTAYSDDYTIRNNIFIGGAVGINATIHSQLYNNVFYCSAIRYDTHLTDNPDRGDYYKPQSAIIRNNIIFESAINMPDESVVDWLSTFTIDHNYYNIESSWLRGTWGERGVGFGEGSIVQTDPEELKKCIVEIPNEDASSYDFHLLSTSPCIDAGIPMPVYYDIEGNPRPYGMEYDIGAYEYTLLPRVVISAQPEKGYLPLRVAFNILELITPNGEIKQWEWDFGDGRTSGEREPSYIYTQAGEYTVTLTVTDIQGYKGQAQTHIVVLEKEKEFGELPPGCYNNVINPLKGEKALIVVEAEKAGRIKINLYDARGNKIKELADEEKEANIYRYEWNGTDDNGNAVGSGLYFVHIQAGDHKKTKKIVVVK